MMIPTMTQVSVIATRRPAMSRVLPMAFTDYNQCVIDYIEERAGRVARW